jgi:hypothetical protein
MDPPAAHTTGTKRGSMLQTAPAEVCLGRKEDGFAGRTLMKSCGAIVWCLANRTDFRRIE